jgi:hypothetical protein
MWDEETQPFSLVCQEQENNFISRSKKIVMMNMDGSETLFSI